MHVHIINELQQNLKNTISAQKNYFFVFFFSFFVDNQSINRQSTNMICMLLVHTYRFKYI